MKLEKKYYKDLDYLRVISCIAVLLYHLNILKGGYLAVCIFFVISGYLSCVSAFRKEKFSLMDYYKNRLLHIYLPLVIVVFITISVVSLIPQITWISLKPETTSVLFGYNNFWQLNANLDYFARNINSPFMHFWYISILLQFELFFPIIYLIFKNCGKKKKIIPCIILSIISILCTVYFYYESQNQNIMIVYYDTFARLFSIIFGISLGFIQHHYSQLIPKYLKKTITNRIIFYLYIILLIYLFYTIDPSSKLFPISMILTSLITCRLIDYGTINSNEKQSIIDKIINFISKISYEVYLVQYPFIFLFQYININDIAKLPLLVFLIFVTSYLLHICLDVKNYKGKMKILTYILSLIIIFITLCGGVIFITAEDHTKEMQDLKDLLNQNEDIMNKKQEEYLTKLKQEQDDWSTILANLEQDETKLKDIVTNLPLIGIGDSVMLGAINDLYATFPNGYFDARVSRTDYEANGILSSLKHSGMLGEPIIFNLGTNGQCGESCRQVILNTCEGRKIFWVNVTNDWEVNVNSDLTNFASQNDNVRIIDWNSISQGHYEYFVADGIHLTPIGRQAYSKAVYDAIYEMYLEEYNKKKEEIITKHEDELKEKITFYGNDLLLNAFANIQNDFLEANFMIDKDLNYETLINELKISKENNSLTYKIVLAFDNSLEFSSEQIQEILNICNNNQIYMINMSNKEIDIKNENLTIINFYKEIQNHKNYLMIDKVHLTEEGNNKLAQIMNVTINNYICYNK